tara:strand:- start:4029 stop:4703 length:675 start_codon:yes stop_codon:yes gene_type:complete
VHTAESGIFDVTDVLTGNSEHEAPFTTDTEALLDSAKVGLGVSIEAVVGCSAGEEAVFITEAGGFGESINGAADGIRAVEDRALGFDEFNGGDGLGVEGVPILHRASAPSRIIEADAIKKKEVLAPGEAANVGGAVTWGGLLNEDAGGVEKSLGEGAGGVCEEVSGVEDLGGVRNVLGLFRSAAGGYDEFWEKLLCGKGEGEKKKDSLHCKSGMTECLLEQKTR